MVIPTRLDYMRAAGQYDIIPVWEDIVVDLETPISIFKKAAFGDYTYLLESVEGGEQVARYSFIGFDPFLTFKSRGRMIEIEAQGRKRIETGEPLGKLKEIMAGLQVGAIQDQPRFCGGAVGYFGYDLVRHHEQLPLLAADDLGLPDCFFILTRVVLIYDHVRHNLKIVALIPCRSNPAAAYEEAVATIERVKDRIRSGLPAGKGTNHPSGAEKTLLSSPAGAVANITRDQFISKVRRAKEYIKAGDVFQVVLSQRFQREIRVHPFDVYRVLRSINPSPYMYYLNFQDLQMVGSSPEMLVRVEAGRAETHPIAGTRPRGDCRNTDEALARELNADPKERAEHLMLVDLGRNDLGRVCEYGTVKVTRFMEIERYSHVMHLVSTVDGRLPPERDAYDALRACFPAGTVSGAPKIRAMEIIEELEPTRRGPYAGAVGYLSFDGNLDSCITIRTIVVKGGLAFVQSGAGIVADSDPETEYEETFNKAEALLKALNLAEGG